MKEWKNADILIIGGGIVGLSTALNLAKMSSKKITVVERKYIASQGSGRNAGGVRQQGRLPAEVPIVMRSMELWEKLNEELNVDTEFRRVGNVFLASSEVEISMHEKMAERLKKQGLHVEVLNEEDMRKVVPALKKGACVGGSYCPSDAMANPLFTTLGYGAAARSKGVEILENTEVTDIKMVHNCIDGVFTNKGYIKCDVLFMAAGSWSPALGKMVGIDLPINPCRNQMIVTEAIPPLVKPFFLTSSCYCNQTFNGNMIIGNVDPDDFCISNNANVNETKTIARNILKYIPQLANVNAIRTWGGPLDLSPDDLAILGSIDEVQGLVVACGFSGHGFAVGPIMGKLLAQHILTGKTELSIDAFRYSRFEEERVKEEEIYAYGQACGKYRE